MIIRLFPATQVPSVLFTLSFSNHLPPALPVPQAYLNQLHILSQYDLEPPNSFHVLDKAVGMIALLHEVSFDLSPTSKPGCQDQVIVKCTFIDGEVKQWTIANRGCVEALQGVLRDVEWSSMQAEREKYEKFGTKPPNVEPTPPPPTPVKKHKKQKSLLMSLVALVQSASSSSSSSHAVRAPSPPPPPPAPPCDLSSHLLRRRARSALVNAFRRHVLCTISHSFVSVTFGFTTWVVQSTLRKNEEKVEALIREAGLTLTMSGDGQEIHTFGSAKTSSSGSRTLVSDSPFFDDESDEGEEETSSTDTDGSSVHTPTESLLHTPFPPSPSVLKKPRPNAQHIPRTPSPPSPPSSPSANTLSFLNTLSTVSHRLHNLLSNLHNTHATALNEEKQMLAVLEVKSKRRAWSNKDLLGGAKMNDLGFGMPEKSSPLGRTMVLASDLDNLEEMEVDESIVNLRAGDRRLRGLEVAVSVGSSGVNGVKEERKKEVARLFPVTEEDEEEVEELGKEFDQQTAQESYEQCGFASHESDSGLTSTVRLVEDAEKGCLLPLPLPLHQVQQQRIVEPVPRAPTPIPPQPQTPIRTRTKSMLVPNHHHNYISTIDLEVSLRIDADLPSSQIPSSPSSPQDIFFHPLARQASSYPPATYQYSKLPHPPLPFEPQTKIEIFDVSYCDDDEEECLPLQYDPNSISGWREGHHCQQQEEFTLSMDVSSSSLTLAEPIWQDDEMEGLNGVIEEEDEDIDADEDHDERRFGSGLPLPVSACQNQNSGSQFSFGSKSSSIFGGRGRRRRKADHGWTAGPVGLGRGVEVGGRR
ncbi:hypothetical protein C8Q75DRAFT_737047 [Abortiporus biennis]|nr:hypothetical protein C8Q75DRAFT_737047 [Abortiporus biennis]